MHKNVNVSVSGPVNADVPKTYNTKFLKPGIPFSQQVTDADTKYVVKYDFDLGGEDVEMPEGCVLEFDGGSIKNGSITGNHTAIDAEAVNILGDDCLLLGSWNNKELFVEWFGGVSGGEDGTVNEQIRMSENNFTAFQSAINSAMSTGIPLELLPATYIVKHGLQWDNTDSRFTPKTLTIHGAGSNSTTLRLPDGELDRLANAWIADPEYGNGLPYTVKPLPEDPTKNTLASKIRIHHRWISGGLNESHPTNVHISGVCFDKNARSCVEDANWLAEHYPLVYYRAVWDEEEKKYVFPAYTLAYNDYAGPSNCIRFYGSYDNVSVKDICVKNKYGSGISFNNPIVSGSVVIDHVYETEDDSARYGAREALYPLIICPKITINDCNCSMQIEPTAAQKAERSGQVIRTEMINCVISSLEFNECDDASLESSFVARDCIFTTGYFNLGGNYPMLLENCVFHMNTQASVIWNDVIFRNCKFYIDAWIDSDGDTIPDTIPFIYPRLSSKMVDHRSVYYAPKPTFENCTFKTTVERPEGASAALFTTAPNTPSYEITLKDCNFDLDLNSQLFSKNYGFIARVSGCRFNVTGDTLINYGSFGYNREELIEEENQETHKWETKTIVVPQVSHAEVYFEDSEIVNGQGFVADSNIEHERGKLSGVFNGVGTFTKTGSGLVGVDGNNMTIMADDGETIAGRVYPKGTTIIQSGVIYKYTSETDGISVEDFTAELIKKLVTTAERSALTDLPIIPVEVYDNDVHKVLYSKMEWSGQTIQVNTPAHAGSETDNSPVYYVANPFTKGKTYKCTGTGTLGKKLYFSKILPIEDVYVTRYTSPPDSVLASTGTGDTFVGADPEIYPYICATNTNSSGIVFTCTEGVITWVDALGNDADAEPEPEPTPEENENEQ